MANANVVAGSNRLKYAIKTLQERWQATEASWDDAARRRFEDRYLRPIDPAASAAFLGMQKLADVLERLRRDCTDRSEMP